MARAPDRQLLIGSIFDRLVAPSDSIPTPMLGQTITEFKRSVSRDLEFLLNTRRRCIDFRPDDREAGPDWQVKLEDTLANYGIPDFTGMNMTLPSMREQARLEIEKAIRRFEPRLKKVSVSILPNEDSFERTLRLRIVGTLQMSPVPQDVIFDSELKPSTTSIEVQVVQ